MRKLGDKVAIIYKDILIFCIITEVLSHEQLKELYPYESSLGGTLSGYSLSSVGDATYYTHLTQTSTVTGNSRYLLKKEKEVFNSTKFPLIEEGLGEYIFQLQHKVSINET